MAGGLGLPQREGLKQRWEWIGAELFSQLCQGPALRSFGEAVELSVGPPPQGGVQKVGAFIGGHALCQWVSLPLKGNLL